MTRFLLFSFVLFFVSCTNPENKVKVEQRQILVNGSPYLIKGICYHPVPIGSEKRSFETLSEDLVLIQEAGINTIRLYSPVDDVAVLDEIARAGIKVIVGFGYNQDGYFDILSGSFTDYINTYKTHPAILFWELGNEYKYHSVWFEKTGKWN